MDSHKMHRRRRITKTFSYERTAPTRPNISSIQQRLLAYELGSISRTKIQQEAAKMTPQLHRLVCHAAIFDRVTDFITEQDNRPTIVDDSMDEDTIEEIPDEDDLFCNFDRAIAIPKPSEPIQIPQQQDSFGLTHFASFNGFAELNPQKHGAVVITTTPIDTEENGFADSEDSSEDSLSTTDSSSEEDSDNDLFDRNSWDADDRVKIQSDWEALDVLTRQSSREEGLRVAGDDDELLWSQQPRVLSMKQANTLMVEALG